MFGDGVGPQAIEIEPEEVGFDGLEVEIDGIGKEVAPVPSLLAGEVNGLLEPDPCGAYEDVFALGSKLGHLGASDFVDGLPQLGHEMKAIEDVDGVGCMHGDEVEIRPPHVAAEELHAGTALDPEPGEEGLERFFGAPASDPQQTPTPCVDLIHQGDVAVSMETLNFINADGGDVVEITVGLAIGDHPLT